MGIGGVSFLVASMSNDRTKRVEEYDVAVQRWTAVGRPTLAAAAFNVSAMFNASTTTRSTASNVNRFVQHYHMEASEAADWSFADVEDANGVEEFQPLKFVSSVMVPNEYRHFMAGTNGKLLDAMPSRADAPTVRFEIEATRTASDGNITAGHFATVPVPLHFVQTVRARTPAPDVKCRNEQHGVWHGGHCHVMNVLAQVCMQIQANGRSWQLRKAGSFEAVGCNPKDDWDIATYVVDPCWMRMHTTPHCPSVASTANVTTPQIVELTLRSSDDPLLFAESLTDNLLDFGLSTYSQHVLGLTLLIIGACMACPLLLLQCKC